MGANYELWSYLFCRTYLLRSLKKKLFTYNQPHQHLMVQHLTVDFYMFYKYIFLLYNYIKLVDPNPKNCILLCETNFYVQDFQRGNGQYLNVKKK